MANYESKTISDLIGEIKGETVLLPSIQRNFVWREEKIASLFDSIMHDYPIGTFLFWDIRGKQVENFVFNTFIDEYNEKSPIQRGKRKQGVEETASFIGVLDGQQRITSLYLGACGIFKLHKKGAPWKNDSSFIDHYLCIDILNTPADEEESYRFALKEFSDKDALGVLEKVSADDGSVYDAFWVKVSRAVDRDFDESEFIDDVESKFFNGTLHQDKRKEARKTLKKLNANFNIEKNVNFYMAKQSDLSEVVEIFVRVNSGGQYLSASDLILSIASGQDEQTDIQKKMQEAIEIISSATYSDETGFEADKDLILIAGLMFTGANSLSLKKKDNCSPARIKSILDNWDGIIESISSAAKYIEDLGFDGRHLTSKNLILPVAYYFFKNGLDARHATNGDTRATLDRVFIRQWLLRAMINSIFRDGIGSTLISIRNIIDSNTVKAFPLDKFMNPESKRSLLISQETITDVLHYKYGDGRVLPILIVLTGFDSTKKYQVDHIWANDNLTKMSKLKKYLPTDEALRVEFKSRSQFLPNLELLDPNPNILKQDMLYDEWVKKAHPNMFGDSYYESNMIPNDESLFEFSCFLKFFDAREKIIETKLKEVFPATFYEIVNNNHLSGLI